MDDTSVSGAENKQLIQEKSKLEEELSKRDAELKRVSGENVFYQRERIELSQTVSSMKKEDANLRTTLQSQAVVIKSLRKKRNDDEKNKNGNEAPTQMTDPVSFDAKLETFSAKLLTKVTEIVDEKLSMLSPKPGDSYADRARDKNQAPAIASPPADFARLLRENKNDELVEEKERHRRANNLIIYGVSEDMDDTTVPQKSKDDLFITSLMGVLDVAVAPTEMFRIGRAIPGKHRPIKLTLSCAEDKESVMANLKNLKNADAVYRSLSIRDDYTMKERDLINKYVQEAKQKNEAENTTEWKVRGTPKNGLRVVRITRR